MQRTNAAAEQPSGYTETLYFLLGSHARRLQGHSEISVPTVLRLLNWRFHFYSDEGQEPPHIHVRSPDGECKFWLSPVRLARVDGIHPIEVRRIEIAVVEHESLFLEKWHEHFRR